MILIRVLQIFQTLFGTLFVDRDEEGYPSSTILFLSNA
jgi:hypothetical protein